MELKMELWNAKSKMAGIPRCAGFARRISDLRLSAKRKGLRAVPPRTDRNINVTPRLFVSHIALLSSLRLYQPSASRVPSLCKLVLLYSDCHTNLSEHEKER